MEHFLEQLGELMLAAVLLFPMLGLIFYELSEGGFMLLTRAVFLGLTGGTL